MTSTPREIPPHFLVIIPGIMGSKLRDRTTGEIVWLEFDTLPHNPFAWNNWLESLLTRLAYPNPDLEPAGLVDQVVFAPPWAKLEQYNRLTKAIEGMGYEIDPAAPSQSPAYTFAYDWRQDNRISALQLGEAVARWQARHPGMQAWIIAHSNGGLVARWYIEQGGGKTHVGRLFLMGSPWDGAPQALRIIFEGMTLFRQWPGLLNINRLTRDVTRTFPCLYQLLPHTNPFLRGTDNEQIDLVDHADWLSEQQHEYLRDARAFHQTLGTIASVETICYFGRKQPTLAYAVVHTDMDGCWHRVDWGEATVGDGTVPERSGVHPNAITKLPFAAGHGDIYVHPALIEVLQWELRDKYRAGQRAGLATEKVTVVFESDHDFYEPGEPILLWATVHRNSDNAPVGAATVQVQIRWRETLPGGEDVDYPPVLKLITLDPIAAIPGRYEATAIAPVTEGYYQIQALVTPPGEQTVLLEDLIAIEAATL